MLNYQKFMTGLAITLLIGGCAGSRSILVEEAFEIDGRSRITWSNSQVTDVYMLSAIGDSLVAIDLKSQNEIRAHKDYIQSVSTVSRGRGGLWGMATGAAVGMAVGLIGGFGDYFTVPELALIFSIPSAMVGGALGVIAGKHTTYTFAPNVFQRETLSASTTEENLPKSVSSSTPPPEPKNDSDVLPEWVPPTAPPPEPNNHIASGGYFTSNKYNFMIRYRRFISAAWLNLPDAQSSANLRGGPYRYYFSLGPRTSGGLFEKSGKTVDLYSELMSLSLGVEGFRHINGLWGWAAFGELGMINGRASHNPVDNSKSWSNVGNGVVAAVGGRLYGETMFGEFQLTIDTLTSSRIPSMVLGIRL